MKQMKARLRMLSALFLVTFAVSAACTPEETVRISASPAPASRTPAATTATPSRTPTAVPTTPAPTPSPAATPTPTTSPGSTPNAACPPQTGGSSANRALLTAIRIAHNPGFDRLVFEFSPSTGPGTYGVPPYTIEVASSFAGPSGQPVTVLGNAFFRVRFQNTDAHTANGTPTLASTDLKPTTPLIKEVRLVEDFEATVVWGVGLDHLVCPSVLTLTGPVRVVFDFPTPP
jgi:hypothetical protein